MAKGKAKSEVPENQQLMRFVPYNQQIRDVETDKFIGISNTAFAVRESDAGGLSLTWIEYYGALSQATIETAAVAFRSSLQSKKLGGKSYFAVGNSTQVRKTCREHGKRIRLVHAPDGPNIGHVELRHFSDDDRVLLDALAIDVFTHHVAVSSLSLPK